MTSSCIFHVKRERNKTQAYTQECTHKDLLSFGLSSGRPRTSYFFFQQARWEQCCGLNERSAFYKKVTKVQYDAYIFIYICIYKSVLVFFCCNSSARSEKLWSVFLSSFFFLSFFQALYGLFSIFFLVFFFQLYFFFAHNLVNRLPSSHFDAARCANTVWIQKYLDFVGYGILVVAAGRLSEAEKMISAHLFLQEGLWLCCA